MTSKNYRASLLHYIKLCASSQTPRWIQTEVTVRERSIRVKIGDFLSHVTLKFDGWPWNTIGHLFFAMLSFVHHFKAIDEFKLELQSGNAEFGSKSAIFLCHATLKFDAWPWKIIGHLFHVASSFVHHFTAIGEFKLKLQSGNAQFGSKSAFIVPCDLEIWRMTFKSNRTHLLCRFKLYVSFRSYRWIRTKVIVQKRSILVKIDVLSRVTLKFDGWPWKIIGHTFYAASSFLHHFVAIGEFKLELQFGNAQFG